MNEFVSTLTILFDSLSLKLPRGKTIEVKPFFGGAAAYVDGHIFMSLTKVGPALKLPEGDREQLFRSRQARKLRYFPKAPIKKQYALFRKSFLDDRDSAQSWTERSTAFVMHDARR